MTERTGNTDDPGGDDWLDAEDVGSEMDRDFSAEDFNADMIAAARLMPAPAPDPESDGPSLGDGDEAGDDYETFAQDEYETVAADEEAGPASAPNGAASLARRDADPRAERQARDIFAMPRARRILRTEMVRVVGARRAESASRALLREYARLGRFRRETHEGRGPLPPAARLQAAGCRVARCHLDLDEDSAEILVTRLSRALGLCRRADETDEYDASRATAQVDLRAATEALRKAARYLLRVERRLAARADGQG